MTRFVGNKFIYDNQPRSSVEGNVNEETYICNICGKNFLNKACLTVHVNSHAITNSLIENTTDGVEARQNVCNICKKRFGAKKNLLKHLRVVHKNFTEAERMVVKKIKCPETNCEFICRMMKELRDHIETDHKIKILKDTLQFPNEAEFQKWKKEEESNTVSWFVTNRKKTTLADGTKKQLMFCHRTGQYNPKGFGKHRARSVGSCKIGGTCPAAMEVTEFSNGHLSVIYYKTHLGHEQDVVYLKLSREEKAHLAEKIEQGFSFDAILEDIKESNGSKDTKKKRIQLLSKKDLYSIMKTLNRGKKLVKEPDKINEESVDEENDNIVDLSGETDESIQNVTYYPAVVAQGSVDNTLKTQRELCSPQTPGGLTSQIVILSPEMNYTQVAEIFLLSTTESPSSSLIPNKVVDVQNVEDSKMDPEEKSKANRINIQVQLKEKMDRIVEFLSDAEFLTPKQFDLIKAKLDGVLDIFGSASARAKTKRRNLKKGVVKSSKIMESWEKGGELRIAQENNVEEQQIYETPVVYAVYN